MHVYSTTKISTTVKRKEFKNKIEEKFRPLRDLTTERHRTAPSFVCCVFLVLRERQESRGEFSYKQKREKTKKKRQRRDNQRKIRQEEKQKIKAGVSLSMLCCNIPPGGIQPYRRERGRRFQLSWYNIQTALSLLLLLLLFQSSSALLSSIGKLIWTRGFFFFWQYYKKLWPDGISASFSRNRFRHIRPAPRLVVPGCFPPCWICVC